MKPSFAPVAAVGALLAGAIAAATAAPPVTGVNPLRVSMYAMDGAVEVILTNTSRKTLRVPHYQLPLGPLQAKLFRVSLDGKPVAYEGPMIKRALPTAADFAVLGPGRSVRGVVDLADAYDMRKTGVYTVTLASPLQFASLSDGRMLKTPRGLPLTLQSAPLRMFATGKLPDPRRKGRPGSGGTVVNGVSYVGCDSTQIATAGAAVNDARTYSENSKGYLAGNLGQRYLTWFGAYNTTREHTVRSNFSKIDTAIDQSGGQLKINCGCHQNYYAYVYPSKPYEIFVCKAFWNAPMTGTDSKAGTLLHEMSHFTVVAGTEDHVYGQTAAKQLAVSDPGKAIDNADNHEYFGENTPFLD